MEGRPVDAVVARWCAADRSHAFVKGDLAVIEVTATVREWIVERLLAPEGKGDRDLLHGFGVLGRLVAEKGGSPTLAAGIVDGIVEALASPRGSLPWLSPARAALAEAFALARVEAARAEAAARWEYPRCAVGLADGTVAIAAGHPEEDEDALSAWASRVAQEASLAGVRRVVFSGSPAAEAALEGAFEIAGIARVAGHTAPTRGLPLKR